MFWPLARTLHFLSLKLIRTNWRNWTTKSRPIVSWLRETSRHSIRSSDLINEIEIGKNKTNDFLFWWIYCSKYGNDINQSSRTKLIRRVSLLKKLFLKSNWPDNNFLQFWVKHGESTMLLREIVTRNEWFYPLVYNSDSKH